MKINYKVKIFYIHLRRGGLSQRDENVNINEAENYVLLLVGRSSKVVEALRFRRRYAFDCYESV